VGRGRGSVLPAAAGPMPGLMPNHSSSPMMPGFVNAPPMSHDQVGPPPSQVPMQQAMSVAQMQVGLSHPTSLMLCLLVLFSFQGCCG